MFGLTRSRLEMDYLPGSREHEVDRERKETAVSAAVNTHCTNAAAFPSKSSLFAFILLNLLLLLVSSPVAAQSATNGLGRLEEPGQVERIPIDEADRAPLDSEVSIQDQDPDPEPEPEPEFTPDPEEATTILPDSEAIDETIEEGEEGEKAIVEEAADPGDRAPAEARPADPQWSIRWQNAFIVERRDDPRYQFLFGGRIQNDWGAYVPDDDLEEAFGDNGTGTKFRRARLYFQGQFFRYGFFKAEYEFADSDSGTQFADVYAGLNLPKLGLIRVGYFKEPFSLQFLNNSNFISFNERSGIDSLTPGRNSGIMLNGNFLIRNSTFAVAFMRRTDDLGEGFSSKEDYHLTTRFTVLPYFEDGGSRLLHLEFGYSHQFADKTEGTRYRRRPGNDFAPHVVDTGDVALPIENAELFNVGLAIVEHSLSLQSEFTVSLLNGEDSEDPIFWGAYVELSWWITGEARRYLRGRGVFSRVVPTRRFNPEKGRWGAVEAAVRYSWLDLSNDGIRGGTISEYSFALNWVIFSNMRVSNNYVLARAGDRAGTISGIAHSWVTRFEIDF